MKIAIVGTGYIGLATGATFAFLGHDVTCLDVDEIKISQLQSEKIPFYEPCLQELICLCRANLKFSSEFEKTLPFAEIIFLTLGTPNLPDGSPDLCYLREAGLTLGRNIGEHFTVVVNKSTVPVGSGNFVGSLIRESTPKEKRFTLEKRVAVVSNPEFLREGSALQDLLYPDRIVLGSDHPRAIEVLKRLYAPILNQEFFPPDFLPRPDKMGKVPILNTDLASAEMIKYAANAFLAVKISFINEVASLSERVGADIQEIAKGIGLDSRIGPRFLEAGIGWGGSCLGKDTLALLATGREYGLKLPLIEAARERNQIQRHWVLKTLQEELGSLEGKTVGLLGLSFKPGTDDLRDAPSLEIAKELLEHGMEVKAHDPVALVKIEKEYPHLKINLVGNMHDLPLDCHALVLITNWPQYQSSNWGDLSKIMKRPLILDGRNYLDPEILKNAGFKYRRVG